MLTKEEIRTVLDTGNPVFKPSLDRLTILGDDCGNFETMVNNNDFGFIKGSGLAKHPYKRSFHCVDGSIIQWTDVANMKAIRYEFNPNNVKNSKEREHIQSVTQILNAMKYPKISRYDYAIDVYGVDLSKYIVVDNVGVKKNYWLSSCNRLETLYIGAPNADTRIRIYDKAVEQKSDMPIEWWRVEVQFRDEACLSVQGKMMLNGYDVVTGKPVIESCPPFIPNPFKAIKFIKPSYRSLKNFNEMAACKMLIEEPEMLQTLSKNSRTKYKKLLASLPTDKELDIESLFSTYSEKILDQILRWLKIPERNDVLSRYKPHDKRSEKELQESLSEMSKGDYSDDEKAFAIESAKMHLLYNT